MSTQSPNAPPPDIQAPTLKKWVAVVLLMFVGILNIIDRFLPAVLAQPIKHDLMLSDTALGLINGFGFLIVYAVVGIPIARLADRRGYGLVISGSVMLWSVMTAIGGYTQAGWQLAATRMGVAVGEAGSAPAAHAFISKNFPPNRRAAALAVLTLHAPIGAVAGLIGGGILGELIGWRMTFVAMGVAGLLLGPLVFFALGRAKPEPEAVKRPATAKAAVGELLSKTSYRFILAGSGCVGIAGYANSSFAPAFLMRSHDMALSRVGIDYGLAAGGAAIIALFLAGFISDRLSGRDPRWLLWVVSLMILILLPFTVLGYIVPGRGLAIAFIASAGIVGTAYMVPIIAAIQRLASPDQRATASAILLFCTAIMGGLGPFLAGLISDLLTPTLGDLALGRALLIVPAFQALAAVFFFLASRSFRRDLAANGHH